MTLDKNQGTDEVLLSWTTTTAPYSVVRNTEPNFLGTASPQIIASSLGSTSFADPTLTDGVDYFYLIKAADSATEVYGVSDTAALPGEEVTLTGVGFATVLGDNAVFIGGESALLTGVTDTSLTFEVPASLVTGFLMAQTPQGVSTPRIQSGIATTVTTPSSVAVDGLGTVFVATTGTTPTSDRVFTIDTATGNRTQVGFLGEATGLAVDNSNRVYYGNATLNTFNQGTIERTTSGGGEELSRACGQGGGVDPCYVFGVGIDPDLLDFGSQGRVYVADGANNIVRLVPPTGLIQDFATGFSFGDAPRGVLPNRNSGSNSYHDVFISDSSTVRRFDSATIPGTLVKTYDSSNSPVMSPRQMALTPLPRERLLIADDGQDRIVMINPDTDASKLIDIPLTDPRGIAVTDDPGTGVTFAYVAEPNRVVAIPVHETVFLSIWVADCAQITDQAIHEFVLRANAAAEECGIEVQIRAINRFAAGALCDLDNQDWSTTSCADPSLMRTPEEAALLDDTSRRSAETTDLNVYFVRSFDQPGIAQTVTSDCFSGIDDASNSGVIISVEKIIQYGIDAAPTLAHELGHALIDRLSWSNMNGNLHFDQSGTQYNPPNIMSTAPAIGDGRKRRTFTDPDQCLNINTNTKVFRGDP